MVGSRVYHHTPLTPLIESSPWVALEYATPDNRRAVAGIFRTSQQGEPQYIFRPRGLDAGRKYKVRWGNRSQIAELSGAELEREGIAVRLDTNLTSELLIFESQ
jgi:alpha-galactosidase